jgi:hypothetical protein
VCAYVPPHVPLYMLGRLDAEMAADGNAHVLQWQLLYWALLQLSCSSSFGSDR